MIATRPPRLITGADGWTITDARGALSAHEEHTVMVPHGDAMPLTVA